MLSNLPPVTKGLLIANAVAFLLQMLVGGALDLFMLWPLGETSLDPLSRAPTFLPWQLVSYGFLHGSFMHLFFNMLAVLMFGAPLEYIWRERRFATFYFSCLIGAGVCQLMVSSWTLATYGITTNTVGASGAVYGLVLAYGLVFPHQRIAVFPLPVMLSARTVAILYGVTALFYGAFGSRDGIAHFAHLGGMLVGWLLLRYWSGKPPFGKGSGKRRRLRVVR